MHHSFMESSRQYTTPKNVSRNRYVGTMSLFRMSSHSMPMTTVLARITAPTTSENASVSTKDLLGPPEWMPSMTSPGRLAVGYASLSPLA